MTLTERFLKAKHWHLFVLIFGIPMLFQVFMMVTMIASIASGPEPDPSFVFSYFKVFPVMMLIFMGTYFGWYWSVAMGLQSKIPTNVKMKTGKFKIFFFTPMIYLFLILIGVSVAMSGFPDMVENGEQPDFGLVAILMGVILPLHLFSMFCMFYCLYFVSKTIKTVELQRETEFSDFVAEFFLIWFYPIGIWIIQPRVNKMAESTPTQIVGGV
jgi:hypothetical protein